MKCSQLKLMIYIFKKQWDTQQQTLLWDCQEEHILEHNQSDTNTHKQNAQHSKPKAALWTSGTFYLSSGCTPTRCTQTGKAGNKRKKSGRGAESQHRREIKVQKSLPSSTTLPISVFYAVSPAFWLCRSLVGSLHWGFPASVGLSGVSRLQQTRQLRRTLRRSPVPLVSRRLWLLFCRAGGSRIGRIAVLSSHLK